LIYSDRDIYEAEQARIFWGRAGLPLPGGRAAATAIAARASAPCRSWSPTDANGDLHAFENRCAHRGSLQCSTSGEARDIICVYHNWSYDLAGSPGRRRFRKGLGGKGGMPADCRPETMVRASCASRRSADSCSAHCLNAPGSGTISRTIVTRIRRVMRRR
jgi:hypothetical protein